MGRKRLPPKFSGIILINKPKGMSSHDVVQRVRRKIGERRIGHTGTLDPLATGLMVLTVGHATRLSQFVESSEKSYRGAVFLGQATTTYDSEGEIVESKEVAPELREKLPEVLSSLTGEIRQKVPAYSAVKVEGQRLYKKARKGEEVELPTRVVHIKELRLSQDNWPTIHIDTVVSKGTYIRSLAVQIGDALGVPAHLVSLHRTSVGSFSVENAVSLEEVSSEDLRPLESAVQHVKEVAITSKGESEVSFGRALIPDHIVEDSMNSVGVGELVRLMNSQGRLCAMAHVVTAVSRWKPGLGLLRYACVFNSGDQVH